MTGPSKSKIKGSPTRWWSSFDAFWKWISFAWVDDAVRKANSKHSRNELESEDAHEQLPDTDTAEELSRVFEETYDSVKTKHGDVASTALINNTTRTLLRLYGWTLAGHSVWVLFEIFVRLVSPLVLRQFLRYLQDLTAGSEPPQYQGWLLAVTLGATGFAMTFLHHRFFWVGMHAGFTMRQQAVAAVHAKALRLNAAAVAHISQGHVVNLVSNDVRRFDDAIPFWLFIWAGPLELCLVLLMVSLELGFLPALAGVSTTLLLIPIQALLVRPVAGIRRSTALQTDERVRLAGEVIQGALAMKMLSWELPFSKALAEIRRKEASHIVRYSRIKAVTNGLQFAITPIVSFTTFAVYRALNGELNVASVFYSLALLHLPKLYVVQFFTMGVQYMTELKVSLTRLDKFLSTEEPPLPAHVSNQEQRPAPAVNSADKSGSNSNVAAAEIGKEGKALENPAAVVALRGADYDWKRPLGHIHIHTEHAQHDVPDVAAHAQHGASKGIRDVTLSKVVFSMAPGELLGICGDVGAGKSSILAALLGELQPLPKEDASVVNSQQAGLSADSAGGAKDGSVELQEVLVHVVPDSSKHGGEGPLMKGTVSYCSQIPWIVAGSVQDNITFGKAYDHELYNRVLSACALTADIAALPAGDQTELGERGINLSGGQKARVGLARAAYAGCDIALLDDPLSAVDAKVGRTLFSQCIGPQGVMQGRTRVLVTHQRQFLPQCDRVMVLRHGNIIALGAWEDVCALDLPELKAGATGMEGTEATVDDLVELPVEAQADEDNNNNTNNNDESRDGDVREVASPDVIQAEPVQSVIATAGRDIDAVDSPDSVSDACNVQADIKAGNAIVAQMVHAEDVAAADVEAPAKLQEGVTSDLAAQRSLQSKPSLLRKAISGYFTKGHVSPAPSFAQRGASTNSNSKSNSAPGKDATVQSDLDDHDNKDSLAVTIRECAGCGLFKRRRRVTDGGADQGSDKEVAGKLVQDEDRVKGSVSWGVYWRYARHIGEFITLVLTVAMISGQAAFLASEWWLALWSKSSAEDQQDNSWLWVYGLLTGLVLVVSLGRAFLFFESTVRAATRIHNTMATTVVRAPLSFFHTNPAGRILNRFSKDLGQVDDLLPITLFDALQLGFMMIGTFVLVSIAVPVILPVFLPLAVAFVILRSRYLRASREVKRWEATTRSPVYAFFSATLKGLPTIRAYGAQDRFQSKFLHQLTDNSAWYHMFLGTARWIGFRLDLISSVTLLATALLAMATRYSIQNQILALALTHVLQLTGYLQWFVRQTAEVENIMTSMERLLEYTHLPQEPPTVEQGALAPPPKWPQSGALEYQSVTATYRSGLPSVLTDITFNLQAGTSCGVVGRTGSGKSSLMLTLFRLIPVTGGRILLDGIDTASIGLDALRKQLAIIPQDPVLFSGTIRKNLDPWAEHDDAALWRVLDAAKLRGAITAAGGLDARMAEAGDNLSVGQRQLFCLARALLQQAKVLALDEATANVDRGTDALIQGALRDFAHSSTDGRVILVIAHRIDTIMDTDHLLVLSSGILVEQGKPTELAARQGGMFAGMVTAAYGSTAAALPAP